MSSLSPSILDKRRVTVIYRGKAESVSWYPDVTTADIEKLLRQIFDIPWYYTILLRDLDGDAVVVSPNLPHNRTFTLFTEDRPSTSYSTPSKEGDASRRSFAASSPMSASRRSTTSPLRSTTPGRSGSSPLRSSTSPFRNSTSSLSSSVVGGGSPLRASTLRSPSPTRTLGRSFSPSRSRFSSSYDGLAASSSSSSYVSPARSASSQLAKETLDRIDKLRNFEKRVRELRDEKFREYFELSVITGDWVWKKDVTSGEFMSSISTDLYWNAGACGLLSTRRRDEVDRILNGALSAYMDAVREMGRSGNFAPVVALEASFAREALRVAYEEATAVIQNIVHEKIKEAEIYTRDAY